MEKHLLLKLVRSDFHKDFHRSNGDLLTQICWTGAGKNPWIRKVFVCLPEWHQEYYWVLPDVIKSPAGRAAAVPVEAIWRLANQKLRAA